MTDPRPRFAARRWRDLPRARAPLTATAAARASRRACGCRRRAWRRWLRLWRARRASRACCWPTTGSAMKAPRCARGGASGRRGRRGLGGRAACLRLASRRHNRRSARAWAWLCWRSCGPRAAAHSHDLPRAPPAPHPPDCPPRHTIDHPPPPPTPRFASQRLCAAARASRSLRTLELPDNRITDAGAGAVAALLRESRKLATLSLAHNAIGDAGAIELAKASG